MVIVQSTELVEIDSSRGHIVHTHITIGKCTINVKELFGKAERHIVGMTNMRMNAAFSGRKPL